MELLERCELCQHDLAQAECLVSNHGFNIVCCAHCGLAITSPRPSAAEIMLYYPRNYYTRLVKNSSLKSRVKSQVMAAPGGYPAPNSRVERLEGMLLGMIARTLKLHIAPLVPHVHGGKLLDVGCGNGVFWAGLDGLARRLMGWMWMKKPLT